MRDNSNMKRIQSGFQGEVSKLNLVSAWQSEDLKEWTITDETMNI